MLSFGQLKNLLKRFEDLNKSMSILGSIDYPRSVLEEREIKVQPVQFYLRTIHYALIEYSPDLYRAILDVFPNIKAMTDQKFVESAFAIGRKVINLSPVITAEQFLMQGKWVEKKLEFVVELCEGVAKWQSATRKKSTKGGSTGGQLKNFMKEHEPMAKYLPPPPPSKATKDAYESDDESDDEDLLVQREITVKPTEFTANASVGKVEHGKTGPIAKETLPRQNRPNVFPKGLKSQFMEEQQEEDSNQFIQTTKIPQKKQEQPLMGKVKPRPVPGSVHAPQILPTAAKPTDESTQHVTRQQFNEVLQMLSSINGTVNGLVSKFNNFQANVTGWFNNTNARLVLLEENVKMIKSNL